MNFEKLLRNLMVLFAMLASVMVAAKSPRNNEYDEVDDALQVASEIREKRHHHHGSGVTGPVHTFVKTDPHANFKWGVRHHVGHHYAGKK